MPTLTRKEAQRLGIEAKAAPSRRPATMNKGEGAYAAHLDMLKLLGDIREYRFEPFKLRLGRDWKTTLTVDFMVTRLDGTLELVDVKGRKVKKQSGGREVESYHAEEDAMVKLKCAAEQYPEFRFVIVWPLKGGGFGRSEL